MSQIWKIFKRKVEETVEVIELTKCLNFSKEERKNEMIELPDGPEITKKNDKLIKEERKTVEVSIKLTHFISSSFLCNFFVRSLSLIYKSRRKILNTHSGLNGQPHK